MQQGKIECNILLRVFIVEHRKWIICLDILSTEINVIIITNHPHITPEIIMVMVMEMTDSLMRIISGLPCCFALSVSAGTRSQFILSTTQYRNQNALICLVMVSLEDDGDTKSEIRNR